MVCVLLACPSTQPAVPCEDRKALERLSAYILRPSFAGTRLSLGLAGGTAVIPFATLLGPLHDHFRDPYRVDTRDIDTGEVQSVAQAERLLAEERSRLAASRAAVSEAEQLAGGRAEARNEISKRLGALEQEIETVNDGLRGTMRNSSPSNDKCRVSNARPTRLLAFLTAS